MANRKVIGGMAMALSFIMMMVLAGCPTEDNPSGTETQLPASKGANALSGKTYFEYEEKIEFSVTAEGAASGTYTRRAVPYQRNGDYSEPVLADGKYTWVDIETGAYSWDADAKKVTLAPEKAAPRNQDGYDQPQTKAQYRDSMQTMLNQLKQQEEMGDEEFNAALQEMGYSSVAAYLDYAVAERFKNVTNNYAFSTDEKALFLDEVLPANKGNDDLAGQTYNGTTWNDDDEAVKDEREKYVFAAEGSSCTYTYDGGSPQTYNYAYDSAAKKVYLKVPVTDRDSSYTGGGSYGAEYYDSPEDAKAAQVNNQYNRVEVYTYNTTEKTLR
ncbi:MAG: hypothetical protein LBD08_08560 [Treponema sp.]|jgi:hypothetical protein|nr:hypothetical protein [Treponema sp.]